MERPPERRHINMMQQGCKPGLAPASGRLVHPGKIGWQGCPALVRTSAFLPGLPSGRGLPSARLGLFSFGGIISTPPRSATPSSARCQTQVIPCLTPPSVTSRRPRRGFLGSSDIHSCVIWPLSPAEQGHLALTMASMLPSTLPTVSASPKRYMAAPVPSMPTFASGKRPGYFWPCGEPGWRNMMKWRVSPGCGRTLIVQ
jgi:hypothetical protein